MSDYVYFGMGLFVALLIIFAFRKPLKAKRDAFIDSMKKK